MERGTSVDRPQEAAEETSVAAAGAAIANLCRRSLRPASILRRTTVKIKSQFGIDSISLSDETLTKRGIIALRAPGDAVLNKTIELYQLRTFVAVAEDGHLTRAAERLHLSQPAVSAHIKALEQALDLRLFDRVASGMALTAAGEEMLARARSVLGSVDTLRRSAAQIKGELIGTLRVGTVSDPQTNRIGDLLACTVRRHPRLQLELRHEVSGAALAAVRERELDASFFFGAAPGSDFIALPLREIVYRVAAPAAWAERIRAADWADVSGLPWVRAPAISSHNQLVNQLFAAHGVRLPPHRIEADDERVIIDLVIAGVGLSLIREDVARAQELAGTLSLWPREALRTTLWFVCGADRSDDPLLRALLDAVRETWNLR